MSENENAGATTAGAPQGNGMATASLVLGSAVAGAAGGVLDSQEFQDAVRDLENLNNNNN